MCTYKKSKRIKALYQKQSGTSWVVKSRKPPVKWDLVGGQVTEITCQVSKFGTSEISLNPGT